MKGKRILLGITGGIAAYKIPLLIRLLIKEGAEVKCILTPAAKDFVSPLTLATLSKNEVAIDFWDNKTGVWANHVELGLWADLFIIAPLTANSLAKMAGGHSDNLLMATYLSAKCPVMVAPAMDLDMYQHPTVKRNIELLEKDGVAVIPAESGELASGLEGPGRMPEPEMLFSQIKNFRFTRNEAFAGQKVLITAGPTYEQIDPVRFVGNHSSGKMGVELAKVFAQKGAEVILLLGPSNQQIDHPNVTVHSFKTALNLLELVQQNWTKMNLGVFAAAVADYRPKNVAAEKIKKNDDSMSIELIKNPDVLHWAGQNKLDHQYLVGFALETEHEERNAKGKLERKNLDSIVLNTLKDEGAGFALDTNKISILDRDGAMTIFDLKNKQQVAQDIVEHVQKKLNL